MISRQTARMNARSCDTSRNAPVYSERKLSSRSIAAEIQVVGRLVEQQQIGLLRQHLRQLQPSPLAARQRLDGAREVRLGEADVGHQPPDPRLQLVAALVLVALLHLAVARQRRRVARVQLGLGGDELLVQALQIRERLEQRVEQRARAGQLLRLAQVGDATRGRAGARRPRPAACRPRAGGAPSICPRRSAPAAPAGRRGGSAATRRRGSRCPDTRTSRLRIAPKT